jgi:hypothetical protein
MYDEIKAEAIIKGPPCSVGMAVEQMSVDERKDFLAAASDPYIASTIITKVLIRRGYNVKAEAVRRHRKGECRCERV